MIYTADETHIEKLTAAFSRLCARRSIALSGSRLGDGDAAEYGRLRAALPDLFDDIEAKTGKPPEVKLLNRGYFDLTLQVGDDHVVKASFAEDVENSATETLTQKLLAKRLPGLVPAVTHVSQTHQVFAMEKLPGVDLASLLNENPEWKDRHGDRLDEQIRRFVRNSADVFTMEEAMAIGIKGRDRLRGMEKLPPDAETIAALKYKIAVEIDGMADALEHARSSKEPVDARFLRFAEAAQKLFAPAFRHEDFLPRNIMVDPESGDMTGVIDYGMVSFVPRYLIDGHYEWRHAHRGGVDDYGSGRYNSDALMDMAINVARKYKATGKLPQDEQWLQRMQDALDALSLPLERGFTVTP